MTLYARFGTMAFSLFVVLVLTHDSFGETLPPAMPTRQVVPESAIELPEFYGVYVLVHGATVPATPTSTINTLDAKLEFLVFDKFVSQRTPPLALHRVPVLSPPSPTIEQVVSLDDYFNMNNERFRDSMAAISGIPKGSTLVPFLGKPITGQPQMTRLIPETELTPGLYQLGTGLRFLVRPEEVREQTVADAVHFVCARKLSLESKELSRAFKLLQFRPEHFTSLLERAQLSCPDIVKGFTQAGRRNTCLSNQVGIDKGVGVWESQNEALRRDSIISITFDGNGSIVRVGGPSPAGLDASSNSRSIAEYIRDDNVFLCFEWGVARCNGRPIASLSREERSVPQYMFISSSRPLQCLNGYRRGVVCLQYGTNGRDLLVGPDGTSASSHRFTTQRNH